MGQWCPAAAQGIEEFPGKDGADGHTPLCIYLMSLDTIIRRQLMLVLAHMTCLMTGDVA